MKSFSKDVITKEMKKRKNLSIKQLQDDSGVHKSSLWHYIKGNRAWNADSWLQTMYALNKAKVYGNKIVIEADNASEFFEERAI